MKSAAADARRHSFFEDGFAFVTDCSFVVLGLVWLQSAGLVTGGIAGLSLLLSYLIPVPAGVLFALLTRPAAIPAIDGPGFRTSSGQDAERIVSPSDSDDEAVNEPGPGQACPPGQRRLRPERIIAERNINQEQQHLHG